ncbi:hypothetical protein ACFQV8_22800 [Pseudonocardia benzenivorans]
MRWSGTRGPGRPVGHPRRDRRARRRRRPHGGIASGIGTDRYGAQIIVDASSHDEAVERGTATFRAAAATAGLPEFLIVRAEAVSEADDDLAWEA